MNDVTKLSRELTYEIADGLAQVSSLLLERRIALRLARKSDDKKSGAQRKETDEEKQLEQFENHLDQLVALFRAYGISLLAKAAQDPIADITAAIDRAKENLKTVSEIKENIMTAAKLVDLGAAILSRDPLAMIDAAKSLRVKAPVADVPSHARPS